MEKLKIQITKGFFLSTNKNINPSYHNFGD